MNRFQQPNVHTAPMEKLEPITKNASDAGIDSDSVCTQDKRFVRSRSLIIHMCSTA